MSRWAFWMRSAFFWAATSSRRARSASRFSRQRLWEGEEGRQHSESGSESTHKGFVWCSAYRIGSGSSSGSA